MKAVILSIGNELLRGQTPNTNATWLASQLETIGLETAAILTVADRSEDIQRFLSFSFSLAPVVVTTGGLGPTPDDLTKEAVAAFFEKPLYLHEESLRKIELRFQQRGAHMPPSNVKQAMLPEGAEVIPNPIGTAPGFYIEQKGTICFVLPGVPAEMKQMMLDSVLPVLRRRFQGLLPARQSVTIRTTGIFESSLYELLRPCLDKRPDFEVAFLPHLFGVDLRVASKADSGSQTRDLQELIDEIRSLLGENMYEIGERSLEQIVAEQLNKNHLSCAVAESCTGGLVADLLTDIPGSSSYFLGGVVAYHNKVKERLLTVSAETILRWGAVSEQTAKEMVIGAQKIFGADCALSVTGIAGPTGGTPDKPVGLVYVGTAVEKQILVKRYLFHKRRDLNKHRFAYAALNQLRQQLLQKFP